MPLITSSIIVGVAGIGSGGNLGALGGKTLLFYATTTLAAILVGLVIINVAQPGIADGQPAGDMLALEADTTDISAHFDRQYSDRQHIATLIKDMQITAGDIDDMISRLRQAVENKQA